MTAIHQRFRMVQVGPGAFDVVLEYRGEPEKELRARSIDRAVQRLYLIFGEIIPEWGGVMFRSLIEPALRDFARDVEDELFGLVERLAKAYGEAAIQARAYRDRIDALLIVNAQELGARLDAEERADGLMDDLHGAALALKSTQAAWGLAQRFQERHAARLEECAGYLNRELANLTQARDQVVEQLKADVKTIADLHGELSDALGRADEAEKFKEDAAAHERQRIMAILCDACREDSPAARAVFYQYRDQGDGHYGPPLETDPVWVHYPGKATPTMCGASAVREAGRS